MFPPSKVDDKVGGGVEDEGEVVEAGQAKDPWVDFASAELFSGAGILLSYKWDISIYQWDFAIYQLGYFYLSMGYF